MVMRFLLVCEGNSDAPLAFHIQRLLESFGCPGPDFNVSSNGRRLTNKIQNALNNDPDVDLIFVHRDADRDGPEARYHEIGTSIQDAGYEGLWVGVVPNRMTEAWLLMDEAAIRKAAGNPNGQESLGLPSSVIAERIPDPKLLLQSILLLASGFRGRRRRLIARRLPSMRDRLLENLPIGGPLQNLESWTRFRDDTFAALRQLSG